MTNNLNHQMDLIFEQIDDLCLSGSFSEVDRLLKNEMVGLCK